MDVYNYCSVLKSAIHCTNEASKSTSHVDEKKKNGHWEGYISTKSKIWNIFIIIYHDIVISKLFTYSRSWSTEEETQLWCTRSLLKYDSNQ